MWFSLGSSPPIYSGTGCAIPNIEVIRWSQYKKSLTEILKSNLDFNELGNSNPTSETVYYDIYILVVLSRS